MGAALALVGSMIVAASPSAGPLGALASVYTVTTPAGSQGAAFLVGNGSLVTAAHVVEGSDVVRLRGTQTPPLSFRATVRYRDGARDIAVLQLIEPATGVGDALVLNSQVPPSGTPVFAVGSPIDGVVLSRGEVLRTDQDGSIVTSTPVDPGNSGGPLLDEAGDALGVVVAKSEPGGEAYTVPARSVQQVLDAAASEPFVPVQNGPGNPESSSTMAVAIIAVVMSVIALVIAIVALILGLSRRRRSAYPPLNITLE